MISEWRRFQLREPRQRLVGGKDAVAQTCKIARAAASDRQPRQGARHVGRGAQRGPDIVTRRAIGDKGRNRIQPPRNSRAVGERRGETLRQ